MKLSRDLLSFRGRKQQGGRQLLNMFTKTSADVAPFNLPVNSALSVVINP